MVFEMPKKSPKFLSLHWIHWIIILVSIALTLFVWQFSIYQTNQLSHSKFNREANQVVSLIEERMVKYVDALHGAVAFMVTVDYQVDPEAWKTYASNLQLEKKYPGINGIGIIYTVQRSALQKFLLKERKKGNDLNIYPAHSGDLLLPISYIEPLSINRKALGLDVAHEANRLHGAISAGETGQPTITGPITLVQDQKKTPGFLLYVPLYDTKEGRKLTGYVYAPFIVTKLMDGVLSKESRYVSVNITDQGEDIFKEAGAQLKHVPKSYDITKNIPMYGRFWSINIQPTAEFMKLLKSELPSYILVAGGVIDFTLILLFLTLARSRKRAIKYAQHLTKELKVQANQDYLTALPNRLAFMDQLNSSFSDDKAKNVSIFYLDLDDFKNINDTMGHNIGDELLTQFGQRLNHIAMEGDIRGIMVARLGGDEFALVINYDGIENHDEVLASEIVQMMDKKFNITSRGLTVKFSIGIANSNTLNYRQVRKSDRAKSLLRYADIAMYEAKSKGKNQFAIFDLTLLEKTERKQLIEVHIYESIESDRLKMVYQPICSSKDLSQKGCEALIRWTHPTLGMVSPMEFIPIAEKTGFIIELGYFIFETVFKQIKQWNRSLGSNDYDMVSINCSTVQLEDPSFYDRLVELVVKYGIDSKKIILEITETAIMENIDDNILILEKLRDYGFSLAIDDFGTGYSSLNYLEKLPVSYLKIDRSFTARIDENETDMIASIIDISHARDIKVIAEGVETESQLKYLVSQDCDYLQGFYFH